MIWGIETLNRAAAALFTALGPDVWRRAVRSHADYTWPLIKYSSLARSPAAAPRWDVLPGSINMSPGENTTNVANVVCLEGETAVPGC